MATQPLPLPLPLPLRLRVYRTLALRQTGAQRALAWLLMLSIALSVMVTMLSTLPSTSLPEQLSLEHIHWALGVLFAVEYVVRLWTSVENKRYQESAAPRLRYAFSPMALIDAASVLTSLLPAVAAPLVLGRMLRVVRALRIVAVLRFGRYSSAMRTLGIAVRSRSAELSAFLFVVGVLLVVAAGLMHVVEGEVQPEHFGSIPDALWWSVTTLTTIGYGDAFPATALGRFVGGFIALVGIGVVAIPAGILASGFQEAYQVRQKQERITRRQRRCPHCGKRLEKSDSLSREIERLGA